MILFRIGCANPTDAGAPRPRTGRGGCLPPYMVSRGGNPSYTAFRGGQPPHTAFRGGQPPHPRGIFEEKKQGMMV